MLGKIARRAAAAMVAFGLAACLTGCASVYDADEKREHVRSLGESVEVDVQFNFLVFYERGPYKIRITPQEISTMNRGGEVVDCVVVDYEVLSTPDGQPAEFATCTLAINLLSEDNGEVEFGIWCCDDQGTQMDPRNAVLNEGEKYTFYIPLVSSFGASRDLAYITVSDRTEFYARSGVTYWYSA